MPAQGEGMLLQSAQGEGMLLQPAQPPPSLVRFHEVDKLLLLVHVELAVDILDVRARRAFRDLQVAGDDGQRASVGQKHDYLAFARCQPEVARDGRAVLFETAAASIRDGGGGSRRLERRSPRRLVPCGLSASFPKAARPRLRAAP